MGTRDEHFTYDPEQEMLTRICARVIAAVEADPEYDPSIKMILMLDNGERGGIVAHGYEDPEGSGPLIDLLTHLRAMFRAQGKDIILAPLAEDLRPRMN
jgi:hypothetical protein